MRKSRLTERRKRELRRSLYIKPLVGIYLFFLVLSLMTGSTNAAFNDIEGLKASLHVSWPVEEEPEDPEGWDNSSLDFEGFPEAGTWGSCEQGIFANVINGGEDMTTPWKYIIEYSPNVTGQPQWEIIEEFEGEIDLLDENEVGTINYQPEMNGKYRFKFIRPEGHPGGDNGGFSGNIEVTDCEEQSNEEVNDNNEEDNEDSNNDGNNGVDKCSDDFKGKRPAHCDEESEEINDNQENEVNNTEDEKDIENADNDVESDQENKNDEVTEEENSDDLKETEKTAKEDQGESSDEEQSNDSVESEESEEVLEGDVDETEGN